MDGEGVRGFEAPIARSLSFCWRLRARFFLYFQYRRLELKRCFCFSDVSGWSRRGWVGWGGCGGLTGGKIGLALYLVDIYLADMKAEKTTTVESLLGVLSLGPMSGYEMRQFMEQSTANFWTESFGQIYPALKAMVAEGLAEVVSQEGEGPTAKKVYGITEAGRERLREWLGVPTRKQVLRHELLLKVFFGDQVERGVVAEQVKREHRRHEEALAGYTAKLVMLERECAGHPGLPFWRMTLRYGMAEARMVMGWCEETLAELEEIGSGKQGGL